MRIGIDCRMWDESGIGRYTRNLVSEIAKIDKNNEYVLFLLKKNSGITGNFQKVVADINWYGVDEQYKFPKIIEKAKIELMHFPHFNVPVMFGGKYVVTVHDLIHHKFRMRKASTLGPVMYGLKQVAYKFVFKRAISRAEKIITVSNYVKKDLEKSYKITGNKIVVTPEGVDKNIEKLNSEMAPKHVQKILTDKGVSGDYIFYVGNAHPHKNIEGLIQVFVELKKSRPSLKLVLGGKENYFWNNLIMKYSKIEGIYYLGYLSDEELVACYKGAKLFVLPSFEEGFGIPILEAFALGTPVVASRVASLPEVGGDGCLYFDPKNLSQMQSQIQKVLDDKSVGERLTQNGSKRLKLFSWKKMAEETLDVYNSV